MGCKNGPKGNVASWTTVTKNAELGETRSRVHSSMPSIDLRHRVHTPTHPSILSAYQSDSLPNRNTTVTLSSPAARRARAPDHALTAPFVATIQTFPNIMAWWVQGSRSTADEIPKSGHEGNTKWAQPQLNLSINQESSQDAQKKKKKSRKSSFRYSTVTKQ